MKIFVTGGAGYVGSFAVRRLLDAGHAVTVFDNLLYGHQQAVDSRARFVEGDLASQDTLGRLLQPGAFDAVMHFAALANVGESVREPLLYYRNNVACTLNLLEAMRTANIHRLVFSSTCAVYGVPEELPLREDLPRDPISPYGASKLAVEWMLRDSAAGWGLGSVALRYFNASGAAEDGSLGEDHTPETHLIPLILQVPLGQRPAITIFGNDYPTSDGTCIRDYVHVEDLASAHVAAVERLTPGQFEAYNVGTGRGYSVLEVIEAARKITGHPVPANVIERRPGDPPALYADARRIRERLGWSPRYTDINEIVRTAWSWHKRRPKGFRHGQE